MNPSPTPSNSNPEPIPSEEATAAALETVSNTPKTLPLKREAAPLFVEATLPEISSPPLASESSAPITAEAAKPVEMPVVEAPVAETATVEAPKPEPEVLLSGENAALAEDGKGAESPPLNESRGAGASFPSSSTAAAPQAIPSGPTVEFSPPQGSFNASVRVKLGCATPGATIRYALDAPDVAPDGALYDPTDALFLKQSTSIVARAFVGETGGPLAQGRFEVVQPGWQKLEPVDQSDPTPHEISEFSNLEGAWHLAGASVRGKLHAHRGGWREDAFRHGLAHAGDGTYSIVVVADGAGSAPLSRVASNLMCEVAVESLQTSLTSMETLAEDAPTLAERDLPVLRGFLVESARLALEKVRAKAAERGRPLSEFSATFLAFVRREWNGQQLCAALQVGDGGIALWNEDETLTILGEADHGGQSGETKFLTSGGIENELAARARFSIRPALKAVAVMSDGIADDFFPEAQKLPELFQSVLPIVKSDVSGESLLDWMRYEKKGSADDRALVVCWHDSAPGTSEMPVVTGEMSDGENDGNQ